MKRIALSCLLSAAFVINANAEPITYVIDDHHTYPSFEADHLGGVSVWRGKFNKTAGEIVLDRAAKTGSVNITVDMASLDFGNDDLNKHASSPDIFDVQKFPKAIYKGTLSKFNGDVPVEVRGELSMHGITQPLTLTIKSFKCLPQHPMLKREVCGADAYATLNRNDFGVSYGINMGFLPEVRLAIQVEALRQ